MPSVPVGTSQLREIWAGSNLGYLFPMLRYTLVGNDLYGQALGLLRPRHRQDHHRIYLPRRRRKICQPPPWCDYCGR